MRSCLFTLAILEDHDGSPLKISIRGGASFGTDVITTTSMGKQSRIAGSLLYAASLAQAGTQKSTDICCLPAGAREVPRFPPEMNEASRALSLEGGINSQRQELPRLKPSWYPGWDQRREKRKRNRQID